MGFLSGKDFTLETPKKYVVLGCQRSGTSFVSNALRSQGVYFGTSGWRCETRPFWSINKSIIHSAGGTWYDPPSSSRLLLEGEKHKDKILEVINEFNSRSPLWGCKDPRMSLTAKSWLDLMDDDVYLICVFRKPEFTANSLRRMGQPGANEERVREYARRIIMSIEEFMNV